MKIYHSDGVPLEGRKLNLTSEGYLTDAPIVARTGIQEYPDEEGGTILVYRSREEVFSEASLASYTGRPITIDHPDVAVNSGNVKDLMVGIVRSRGEAAGPNVVAPITIFDGETVQSLRTDGPVELSVGYFADIVFEPGEFKGRAYDAVQRNIVVNHVAIVPRGRAGNAALNLDENKGGGENKVTMVKIVTDSGIAYDAAPEVKAYIDGLKEKMKNNDAKEAEAVAQADRLAAELAVAKKQVDAIPEKIKAGIADAVEKEKARDELLRIADSLGIEVDGKDDDAIVADVLVKTGTIGDAKELKDRSPAYVAGLMAATLAGIDTTAIGDAEQRKHLGNPTRKGKSSIEDAEESFWDALQKKDTGKEK